MNQFREQMKAGKFKTSGPQTEFKPEHDFQLTDDRITNQETRIRNLGPRGKEYIKQLDKIKREEYCELVFAPFKPTQEQRQKLIELLESIGSE